MAGNSEFLEKLSREQRGAAEPVQPEAPVAPKPSAQKPAKPEAQAPEK